MALPRREEREPGGARGIRPTALGQDATDGVLSDLDATGERMLLGVALTAEPRVATLHLEDGIGRLGRRALGTGGSPALRGEQSPALSFRESAVEAHEGGGLEHYRGPQESSRANHMHAQAGDQAIAGLEVWGPLAGPVEDQQLVSEKHGFGDDRAGATRAQQSKSDPDEVNEEPGDIEHRRERSGGIEECNRRKFEASELQNDNSHPTAMIGCQKVT